MIKYKKIQDNENAIEIDGKVVLPFDKRFKEYLKWRDKNPELEKQLVEELEQETENNDSEFDAEEFYGDGLAAGLEEVGIDPVDISNRFQENDEISEDDYSKLSDAGFSKQIVDTYLDEEIEKKVKSFEVNKTIKKGKVYEAIILAVSHKEFINISIHSNV